MALSAVFMGVAFVAVVVVTVWWVRRPVSARRAGPPELPLFSHRYASFSPREAEDDDTAAVIAARATRDAARAPSWREPSTPRPGGGQMPSSRGFAPPPGYRARESGAERAGERADRAPTSRTVERSVERMVERVRQREVDRAAPQRVTSTVPQDAPSVRFSVRFSVPTDSTLQFLPGRLAVLDGADAGRDLRFVRLPGIGPVDITFGRSEGAPYRHVQLDDPTVSRIHARLSYRDQGWWLANLSSTNPVMLNGAPVTSGEHRLAEGDRVEMGEVAFRFHV